MHATESWDLHRLMHRARSLIRAERADRSGADLSAPSMVELAAGFRRIWAGYYAKKGTHPAEVASLLDRVQAYDNDIRALRLHDHELNRTRTITEQWKPVVLILQAVLVYVIIPPILLIGYVVNAPVYFGLNMLTQRMARADKDEASIKLLGGMVFYPLAWLIVALLVALGVFKINALYPDVSADPLTAGVTVFLFSAIGGVIALLYLEMLRETWRGLRTTLTRRQRWLTIEHLRLERAALHDDLTEFASDVELPGELLPDGRILPEA